MIFGHFGVAAFVRATQRDPHSGRTFIALCAAAVTPDIVDVTYALTGVCSPFGLYSHTVPALALEAAVVGGVVYLITGSRWLTLAFVLLLPLHLAADYFTMNKLVMPGGELHGLDLNHHPLHEFVLEAPCIIAGWWMLKRSGRGPRWAVSGWALGAVLTVQGALNTYSFFTDHAIKPNSCRAVYAAPVSTI